jgi:sensor histidine kinase YesM
LTIALLKLGGFTLIVTAAVLLVTGLLRSTMASSSIRINFEMVFEYALIIGSIAWLAMPHLGEWAEDWLWPFRWATLLTALCLLGFAGTALASVAIHYTLSEIQWIPAGSLFEHAWRTAVPTTIIAGVITTLIVAGNDRLKLSQAALQEQRLQRERAEKLAVEAQLASLASRVQPHFLFNTLNSIAALIRENPAQAEQTVERLAALLRSSLDGATSVPIEQELKLVRDYLEIQKTRWGERLKFDISAESGLRAIVPLFSIQTLVENSLKHVAGKRQQGVDLRIRAGRQNGRVVVSVTDDGPGFDAVSMKPGGGLEILQTRLRVAYGGNASLEFQQGDGRMTMLLQVPETK